MRIKLFRAAFLVGALSLSGSVALADSYTFSLVPANGQIVGLPGSTIGWGYSITNNSATNYLDPLAVNAGLIQNATLDSGDYFDFPLVAPGATVTVDFMLANSSGFGAGLAALTWNSNAPIGAINSGNFDLSACWANSKGSCIQTAPDALAAYSATVAAAPEPSSIGLSLLFIVSLSLWCLHRKVRLAVHSQS